MVVAGPVLLLLGAAGLLYVDLRVQAGLTVAPRLDTEYAPLPVGVYLSEQSQHDLAGLKWTRPSPPDAAPWQVLMTADSGELRFQVNYGPLVLNAVDYSPWVNNELSGSLPRPVDLVFVLPPETHLYKFPEAEEALMAARPDPVSDACAEWSSDGQKHTATPATIDGEGGYPVIAICQIPAIRQTTDLVIALYAYTTASSAKQSLYGTSQLAFEDPEPLELTMYQDSQFPARLGELKRQSSQPYDLHLRLTPTEQVAAAFPDPAGGTFTSRQWPMAPGSQAVVDVVDSRRVNQVEVFQQFVLILAGMLFGLVPAAIPPAARARKRGRPDG